MKNTIIALSLSLICATPAMGQNILHVDVNGSDANNASASAPVRSIQRAIEIAASLGGENRIALHEGVHRPDTTIVLTRALMGNAESITICPFGHEKATISGSRELSLKWSKHKGGILKSAVKGVDDIDMLIVNGEIRPMARYPNYDPSALRLNGTSADATSPTRIRSWKNPEGGFLHAMHSHDWGDFHYRIDGKDTDSTLILTGGHQNNRRLGISRDNRMVENIFEELDAPGEWYYDKRASTLYYYPLEGEDMRTAVVEAPTLKHLFHLKGSPDSPLANVSIQGVDITGTRRTFMEPYEPLLRSDWTVYIGGAILLSDTENCSIADCDLYNLGGNGIFFSGYNRDGAATGNHISRIGASAILFVGDPSAVRSPAFEYGQAVELDDMDFTPGPANDNYPSHCVAEDNLIHDIGMYEKQTTGVELSMCSHITVGHNSIYDVPRAGINVSEGTWGGHIIEFNDIFDTVKETGDHGSFNSWGRDRYWHPNYRKLSERAAEHPELITADAGSTVTIRNNRLRCDRGWDIDLDDGSSNYRIYSNLCLNGGIKLREGFFRTVENNIMVNNSFHPHVWLENSGDVFARNIVMTSYRPIQVKHWGSDIDHNIFLNESDLKAAQANGTDSASVALSLTFADFASGDYSLAEGRAEALRHGFREFGMHDFGVKSERLRALARKPVFSAPIAAAADGEASIIEWHGCRLKSLDTLGEQSATGMDSQRGVYVLGIRDSKGALGSTLQPNDVILGIDGANIESLADLRKLIESQHDISSATISIFRNQRNETLKVASPRK